ncbi:MAG: SDR family NAD(P)-dependent oxidoreductase [Desulfobacterales bacterium]
MIEIKETLESSGSVEEAFDYLANFANIQAWDPTVLAARGLTAGPVRVGSRFRLLMQFGLRPVAMHYSLVAMEPPGRLVFDGQGASFRVRDDIRIQPLAHGFRLNYTLRITFDDGSRPLWAKMLAPLIRRNARRAIKRLQTILGGDGDIPHITRGVRLADRLLLPGLVGFTRLGYHGGRRRWPLPPQPLQGRRVVLTGGTSGIGRAAAEQLRVCGAHLVMVGRNPHKTDAVCRELRRLPGSGEIDLEIADLSLMAEIRALARRLKARYAAIHVLINNAGALFNTRQETSEGFERTLATDLLGPYLLTRSLAPLLARAPGARIVNVSSGGMHTQKIQPHDLSFRRTAYDGPTAYARAKRGLVILTESWAKELAPQGIRVHAMHPGWVDTPGLQSSLPVFHRLLGPLLRTPDQGADTITWLAASPVANRTSGLFWLDRQPRSTHVLRDTRESPAERQALLDALERLVQPYL